MRGFNSLKNTEYLNTTQLLLLKEVHLKKKSLHEDLDQETYRKTSSPSSYDQLTTNQVLSCLPDPGALNFRMHTCHEKHDGTTMF